MKRELTSEIMDAPQVPRNDLDRALRYIRWINTRFGGVHALLSHLEPWSARWEKGRPVTLLDVGTGSGDLPLAAAKWAKARGHDLRVTGLDKHPTTTALARDYISVNHEGGGGAVTIVEGDALELDQQYSAGSFDYVHAGLFLHHLNEDHIVRVLTSMNRIARRGIIWNDLVRSRIGYAFIWLFTIGQPEIVRHDARVSVKAGFTKPEAMNLARAAGISYADHRWNLFTHRFTVAGEKK